MLFHFEHRSERLLPWPQFLNRLLVSVGVGAGLILVSLFGGMAGYHYLEKLSWMDAFLNASMILSGMGPFDMATTVAGQIFEGTYALYSGLLVVGVSGLILAPVFHRVLHSFHVPDEDDPAAKGGNDTLP